MAEKSQNSLAAESEPDYSSLPVEDLDKILSGEMPDLSPPAPEKEEKVVEEPEAEPEQEAPAEEEAKEEEPKEEEKPEVDSKDLMIQELEARVKHFESLAGRNAGELGFVKQQLRKLQESQHTAPREEEAEYVEPDSRPAPSREPKSRDEVVAWAVSQAVQQAAGEFATSHSDAGELQEAMQAYLSDTGYNPKDVFDLENPIAAARETKRALEEAYWHAKATRASTMRKEAETRRAAQIPQMEKAKRKAAISGSGAAPPPKPKPKTYADMTVDELEAEIQKELNSS